MGLMFLVALLVPLAIGENDSLHVVLTVDDLDYRAEQTVTVKVNVYDKGQLIDVPGAPANNITLTVRQWGLPGHPWTYLTLTHDSTGAYHSTLTITEEYRLQFRCEVEVGNDYEEDEFDFYISDTEFSVDVNFDGQEMIVAHPGDVVTATIEVRYGSTLVDVSGFDELTITDPEDNEVSLSSEWVNTGIYQTTYTIPSVIRSGAYEITASPEDVWHEDSATIQVNVLDVWYHKLSSYGETVSFEVCVANLDGQPVNEAFVLVQRGHSTPVTGTTNESGRINMQFINVHGSVWVDGFVRSGSLNQSIAGVIYNPQPESAHHSGLDIIWNGNEKLFSPGETVTIPYTAFFDEELLSGQVIYYYVTARGTNYDLYGLMNDGYMQSGHIAAPYDVVATGSATTNIGQFSISFTVPTTQCLLNIRFEVPIDRTEFPGQDYDHDDNLNYENPAGNHWDDLPNFYVIGGDLGSDNTVRISGGSFKPGRVASVGVTMPVTADDSVMSIWGIGEFNFDDLGNDEYDPEWMSWVPGGALLPLSETSPGEYEGNFVVPSFIENQDTVTIITGYMDGDTGIPHYSVKHAGIAGSGNTLLIIGIVVILVVVVLVVYLIKK
jgi:hypothetical protein